MTNPTNLGEHIPEMGRESWADHPAYASLDQIAPLSIDADRYRYVLQGTLLTFAADELDAVGSEGFISCSGFLMRQTDTGLYAFAHAQPYLGELHDELMEDGERTWDGKAPKAIAPAEAVFIYGSNSIPQADVQWPMQNGYWGDVRVSSIRLDTGDAHFHMAFRASTGILSIVRKTPEQTIHHYQVFEPND